MTINTTAKGGAVSKKKEENFDISELSSDDDAENYNKLEVDETAETTEAAESENPLGAEEKKKKKNRRKKRTRKQKQLLLQQKLLEELGKCTCECHG